MFSFEEHLDNLIVTNSISLESKNDNRELISLLNELMEKHKIVFDINLYKTYLKMLNKYISKNQEHIDFFSGKLLGVHIVRFTNDDYADFFRPLDITPKEITNTLKDFYTVKQKFALFGDPFYLLGFYMIHAFLNSKYLKDNEKDAAAKTIAMFMNLRMFTSMYTYRFMYPVNKDLAQAVYEGLSGKYMIKKVDSWYDLFVYRSKDLTDKDGLHYKIMSKFDDDKGIINAINDTRNRLSSLISNIYSKTMDYHAKGIKISTTNMTVTDLEGNDKIKDVFKNYLNDITLVKRSITNYDTFINNNLLDIVIGVTKNTNREYLVTSLRWIVDNYIKENKLIDELITESLENVYDYLNDNNTVNKSIIDALYLVKNYIISSRREIGINKAKDVAGEIIKNATKKSSNSIVIPLKIAIIMYIFLKTYDLRKK